MISATAFMNDAFLTSTATFVSGKGSRFISAATGASQEQEVSGHDLLRMQKHSFEEARSVRARLQSCRKRFQMRAGLQPLRPRSFLHLLRHNAVSKARPVILAFLFAASALAQVPPANTLHIGLWTLWHDQTVTISPIPESSSTIRLCASCPNTPLTHPTQIRAAESHLVLTPNHHLQTILLTGPVTLQAHGETLTLRNPIRITARSNQLILAVTLPIESYVERVVASESGAADTPESLKALAITVRSFALHQSHGHPDYDLCDSTHCQLLHWSSKFDKNLPQSHRAPSFPLSSAERVGNHEPQPASLRQSAHTATLTTAGETLWYHGHPAQAWFHQNCGGRTATPQEVWPAITQGGEVPHRPMPWLVSRPDPYCNANGAREWSADLSLSNITSALATQGLAHPGWKALTVSRRGESGRAVTLRADTTEFSAEDFRLAIGRAFGWGHILSTWFEVSQQGDHFLFHGRGSGHGVGLCQAGSAAMASQGRDLTQILAQYFPGATAADESTGKPWQTLRAQGFTLETLNSADAVFLPQLSRALADAQTLSTLQPPVNITVRAFASTPAFRDATLAPGWVAAFTEGNWIATQPLSTLAARKLLAPVLRHEFLHALVESQSSPNTPLWLREGLVEAWSNAPSNQPAQPTLKLDDIDRALTPAATEEQSEAAHRAAAWYARRLLNRYGRDQAVAWLHSSLPPSAVASFR
jgi:stage II sporulation protein D